MIIDIDEKKVYPNTDFIKFPQNFVDDISKNFKLIDLTEIETKMLLRYFFKMRLKQNKNFSPKSKIISKFRAN